MNVEERVDMPVKTTLTSIGDGWGIVLDRSILEAIGIDRDTPIALSIADGELTIRPWDASTDPRRDRVRRSAARLAEIHRETLRKLAE